MGKQIVHSEDMVWVLDPAEAFAGPVRMSILWLGLALAAGCHDNTGLS